MALIVGGTTVTGTQTLQASTLTGTASAINGSNITNLPAPTTSNVLSATAGLTLGAVGTYTLLRINSCSATFNEGEVVNITLYWTGLAGQVNQGTASGTWRSLGYMTGCAVGSGTVCVRIS